MLNAPFFSIVSRIADKETQVRKKPSFSLPPMTNGGNGISLWNDVNTKCVSAPWKRYVINDVRTTTYRDTTTDKILTEARSFRLFCLWNGETTRNERLRASFTFMICIRSRIMSLSIEAHRAFLLSLTDTFEERMRGRDSAPTPISSRISPRLGFQSFREKLKFERDKIRNFT